MRKFFSTLLFLSVTLLVGCGSETAMTEEQQAAQYNMTVEEYRQEKQAAARMNMSWDEHVKMLKMEGKIK